MSYLSKDDIWKADDLPTRDVEVPEWGGTVRVRALSGAQRDEFNASTFERRADGSLQQGTGSTAKLVSLSIVDEDGNQMFSELEVGRLSLKSAIALGRVVEVINELAALTPGSEAELEGNSDAALSGGSGSISPEN